MPEVAEAPIAPAAPTTVAAPSKTMASPKVGSVMPPSKGEIHVVPPSVEPAAKPAKGSAKDEVFSALRKKAKPSAEEPAAKPSEKTESSNPDLGDDTPVLGDSDDKGAAPEAGKESPEAAKTTATPEERKKVSPWKLVDEFKRRAVEAEAKYLEATKGIPNPDEQKKMLEEVKRIHERNAELEEEIKFVNFQKSKEYQEKYDAPYKKAWSRAMSEIGEIPVTDPATGESRPAQAADLLDLVNLPLGKAREAAVQLFGDFADDVMAHRKEIRSLYDAQNTALEEARKAGAAREQQRSQQFQQMREQITKQVSESWAKENEAVIQHEKYGKYFSPVDGDEEGNKRLEKGYALVDKAFAESPFAPHLKPEERAAIIKRHAAVRNRAAAFGRLTAQVEKLVAREGELMKELEQYKSSTPTTEGGQKPATDATPTDPKEAVFSALRKLAK